MFTKFESMFWTDEKIRLSGDEIKLLMCYLITCPHKNIIGLYYLPEKYVCEDLKWNLKKFRRAILELEKLNRILYDSTNNVILIKNYFKHNPLENPNQVKAAIKKLRELPDNSCFLEFDKIITKYFKEFMKPLQERLRERLPKPLPEPLPKPFAKPVEVEVEVEVEVKEEVTVIETVVATDEIHDEINESNIVEKIGHYFFELTGRLANSQDFIAITEVLNRSISVPVDLSFRLNIIKQTMKRLTEQKNGDGPNQIRGFKFYNNAIYEEYGKLEVLGDPSKYIDNSKNPKPKGLQNKIFQHENFEQRKYDKAYFDGLYEEI